MKYMGSKARIAKEILPIILKDSSSKQWYIEPFIGGANIIDKINDRNRIGADSNYYLIEMWRALQNGWVPEIYTKDFYTQIRDNKNSYFPFLVGYIGFNCSYSGKWFGGFAGEVKTKIGTIRNYQEEARRNILAQVPLIKDIDFIWCDYSKLKIPENSIIYCDPPYKNTTEYKDKFNHEQFYEWCRKQKEDGHYIFISEYDMPKDFKCIWDKEVKSSLSANGKTGGNKNSIEKLYTL